MEKEWFRKRVDDLRKQHNWSKCKLNDEAGLASGMIYQWYNTDRTPTVQNIEAICKAVDISVCEFFADNQDQIEEIKKTELYGLIDELTPNERQYIIQMIKGLKTLSE